MWWSMYWFSRLNRKEKINNKSEKESHKFFQYAVTVALNYGEIESDPENVSNIKLFVNKYKWKGIKHPSKIDDWKTFEKNNLTVSLNILYIIQKEICPAYISKINSNCEKQTTLLMIPNEEKQGRLYQNIFVEL